MALVPAWDTRTGEKLPNDVPKSWLQNKIFPHLVGSEAAAKKAVEEAAATTAAETGEATEAAVQTEANTTTTTTTTRKGR